MERTLNDAPTPRRDAIELVAVSFVVLFVELALIRWLAAQVRVLAYFPNVVLIAAFLGLGIGSMRARKARMASNRTSRTSLHQKSRPRPEFSSISPAWRSPRMANDLRSVATVTSSL